MDKKKILFVVANINITNGVSSFLFNYLKHMNLELFDISILSSDYSPEESYVKFCRENDIKLHFLPIISKCGIGQYLKALKEFFKQNNNFDIVYSHVANQAYFVFKLAKKYNIKVRAIHAHATKSSDTFIGRLRNSVLNKLMLKYATNKFACGKLAGKALFGKNSQFKIINNAIDYSKFSFKEKDRCSIRKSLHIKDSEILLGFVGRFVPQKNIYFFVELLKMLDNNYKLLMIGSGPLKEKFIYKCKELNIIDKLVFVDEIDCVNKYYSAMDIFCLPSLFEGLPVVGVEAQANGLQCIFSNNITLESKILEKTKYVPLNIDEWVKQIKASTLEHNTDLLSTQFNIVEQARIFEKILLELS